MLAQYGVKPDVKLFFCSLRASVGSQERTLRREQVVFCTLHVYQA